MAHQKGFQKRAEKLVVGRIFQVEMGKAIADRKECKLLKYFLRYLKTLFRLPFQPLILATHASNRITFHKIPQEN